MAWCGSVGLVRFRPIEKLPQLDESIAVLEIVAIHAPSNFIKCPFGFFPHSISCVRAHQKGADRCIDGLAWDEEAIGWRLRGSLGGAVARAAEAGYETAVREQRDEGRRP